MGVSSTSSMELAVPERGRGGRGNTSALDEVNALRRRGFTVEPDEKKEPEETKEPEKMKEPEKTTKEPEEHEAPGLEESGSDPIRQHLKSMRYEPSRISRLLKQTARSEATTANTTQATKQEAGDRHTKLQMEPGKTVEQTVRNTMPHGRGSSRKFVVQEMDDNFHVKRQRTVVDMSAAWRLAPAPKKEEATQKIIASRCASPRKSVLQDSDDNLNVKRQSTIVETLAARRYSNLWPTFFPFPIACLQMARACLSLKYCDWIPVSGH